MTKAANLQLTLEFVVPLDAVSVASLFQFPSDGVALSTRLKAFIVGTITTIYYCVL